MIGMSSNELTMGAQIASIILVGVLIWQVTILKQQISRSEKATKLAHWPYLSPRYEMIPGGGPVVLIFENVGEGSAINIHLELSDADSNKKLRPFVVFALKPNEPRPAGIDLLENKRIKIKGTYENTLGDTLKIDTIFDYPKKKLEDNEEKI